MFISSFYCLKNVPTEEMSISPIQKKAIIGDLVLSIIACSFGLLMLLAAFNVPLGSLNALGEAGILGGSLILGGALLLQVINISLPCLKKCKRPKNQEISLKNLMPTKTLDKGRYASCCQPMQKKEFVEITSKKFFRTFLEQDSQDPFRQELEKEVKGRKLGYTIEYPETFRIKVPDKQALCYQASKYFEKYNIVIRIANTTDSLIAVLDELNTKIKSPLYVGIITSEHNIDRSDSVHVTPLLFYFPGNRSYFSNHGDKGKIECIILDSLGGGEDTQRCKEILWNYGLPRSQISFSSTPRQADNRSCHTEALVLLRNALLFLQINRHTDGFNAFLQMSEMGEDGGITSLPPEIDYIDQIKNPRLEEKHQVITRCFHTHKPMLSAKEHRANYMKPMVFKYQIKGGCIKHITSNPPEDVEFSSTPYHWNLTFTLSQEVNMYLVEKAEQMAEDAEVA